ncbi:hypothetical protein [Hymenobacter sp. B81]|uniref:hypothetical protein n=1 Tax=Hymenobacter sp. B81 TaxID=3344878 RepID=UPI0037DD0FFB
MTLEGVPDWLLTLHQGVNYLGSFGVAIPLLIGLRRWPSLSGPARALVWYFAFWTLEAPVNLWSRRVLHTNIYLYHLDSLVETWLLGWVYYRALPAPQLRRWFVPAGLIFTAVVVADATVLSGLQALNEYARIAQTVLLLTLTILYFDRYMWQLPQQSAWRDFMFVVSLGLAVYYAGSVSGYVLFSRYASLGEDNPLLYSLAGLIIDSTYLVTLVLLTLALSRDQRPRGWPVRRPVGA